MANSASDPIVVEEIIVRTGRLVCTVVVPDPRHRTTTPALAAYAQQRFPDLPEHACVNGRGRTFAAVMRHTSLPHLLEHVAISLLTRNAHDEQALFTGVTSWSDKKVGRAVIELSFTDDLDALRAFGEATKFLNEAVLTCLA